MELGESIYLLIMHNEMSVLCADMVDRDGNDEVALTKLTLRIGIP